MGKTRFIVEGIGLDNYNQYLDDLLLGSKSAGDLIIEFNNDACESGSLRNVFVSITLREHVIVIYSVPYYLRPDKIRIPIYEPKKQTASLTLHSLEIDEIIFIRDLFDIVLNKVYNSDGTLNREYYSGNIKLPDIDITVFSKNLEDGDELLNVPIKERTE